MEYFANEKKQLTAEIDGTAYLRHAVKTHYITVFESYLDIMEQYALPLYREGDIFSISEKIIALCQGRVIYKKDVKPGFLARFLSKFVNVTPAGEAVGNPYKMQIAIMLCGGWKVFFAAVAAGIGKLFRKKGIFYDICGPEVTGLDGFCDDAFTDYLEMGIRIPENPGGVCAEIEQKLGLPCAIVDANDLTVTVLGKSPGVALENELLARIIKDNPAGQGGQQTPIILIRPAAEEETAAAQDAELLPQ